MSLQLSLRRFTREEIPTIDIKLLANFKTQLNQERLLGKNH